MSNYHKASGLLGRIAKPDWATTDGTIAGVQDELMLRDYGTAFQIWRNGVPIDEEAARQAIASEVTSPPVLEEYRRKLRGLIDKEGDISFYTVEAHADPSGLEFEHGNFKHLVSLDPDVFEVVVGAKDVERRRSTTQA